MKNLTIDEVNRKIEEFKEDKAKIFTPRFSEEEYITRKFGNSKHTYQETLSLIDRYERRYAIHVASVRSKYASLVGNERKRLHTKFYNQEFKKIPKFDLKQILLIDNFTGKDDKEGIVKFYENYKRNVDPDRGRRLLFSFLRKINSIPEEKIPQLQKFVSENWNSKEEFFVDIIVQECSFMYKFDVFGPKIKTYCNHLNYWNKRFQSVVSVVDSIHRNRFPNSKAFENIKGTVFEKLIIKKVMDGSLWLDMNKSETLLNIFQNFDLTYDEKKDMIYKFANQCSYVIAGNRTLETYNLPFEEILTKEDYQYMIDEIIFIGNNHIKISLDD